MIKGYDGAEVKRLAKEVGIGPTELAFKAGMSASNLRKVFDGSASYTAFTSVLAVLEPERREKLKRLQVKAVG